MALLGTPASGGRGGLVGTRRAVDERIELAIGLGALAILAVGCFFVLRPFLSSLLWGVILAYTTWPAYEVLLRYVRHRRTIAATLMTLGLALAFIAPLVLVGTSAAEGIAELLDYIRSLFAQGLPAPPQWLIELPVIGPRIGEIWADMAYSTSAAWEVVQPYFATIRDFAIGLGVSVGGGLLEITLSVLAAFFFFRDGTVFAAQARAVTGRIFGDRAQSLIEVAGSTVKGVVYGIVGTALIQGVLAGIGYLILGMSSAFLLGFLSFILALLPLGPPVIWIPITIWLFSEGEIGWAIFLLVWGIVVVGSSDNFIRPWLISRGSKLTFLPVFLGVVGGALAFGFLGIFLGPVLLAVGFAVLTSWAAPRREILLTDQPPN